jgi:hypothetical protein
MPQSDDSDRTINELCIHNTLTFCDGKTPIHHKDVLIESKQHLSIFDVWSFSGSDHSLVVAEFTVRLSVVNKQHKTIGLETLSLEAG